MKKQQSDFGKQNNVLDFSEQDYLRAQDVVEDLEEIQKTEGVQSAKEAFVEGSWGYISALNNAKEKERIYLRKRMEVSIPTILLELFEQIGKDRENEFIKDMSAEEVAKKIADLRRKLRGEVASKIVSVDVISRPAAAARQNIAHQIQNVVSRKSADQIFTEAKELNLEGEFIFLGTDVAESFKKRLGITPYTRYEKQTKKFQDGRFEKTWYYPTNIKNVYLKSYLSNQVSPMVREQSLIYLNKKPRSLLYEE